MAETDTENTVESKSDGRARQLAALRPWPKGVSGNPGGVNPELVELRRYAQSKAKDSLDRIEILARSAEDERVRLAADVYLANRAMGMPTQETKNEVVSVNLGPPRLKIDPTKLNGEEFRQMRELLLKMRGDE